MLGTSVKFNFGSELTLECSGTYAGSGSDEDASVESTVLHSDRISVSALTEHSAIFANISPGLYALGFTLVTAGDCAGKLKADGVGAVDADSGEQAGVEHFSCCSLKKRAAVCHFCCISLKRLACWIGVSPT